MPLTSHTHFMKRFVTLLLFLFTISFTRAGLVYSGIQNVPIPQDLDGVYLRIDTGAITHSYPLDWDTAPWINPFFGGVGIATSPLLRPIITGINQIQRLDAGAIVGPGGNFAPGEIGSSTHVGPGAGQFQIGVPGTIGLVFESESNGPSYYGWVGVEIKNTTAGNILSWGFNDVSGESVAVPEVGTVSFGLAAALAVLVSRRRHRQGHFSLSVSAWRHQNRAACSRMDP